MKNKLSIARYLYFNQVQKSIRKILVDLRIESGMKVSVHELFINDHRSNIVKFSLNGTELGILITHDNKLELLSIDDDTQSIDLLLNICSGKSSILSDELRDSIIIELLKLHMNGIPDRSPIFYATFNLRVDKLTRDFMFSLSVIDINEGISNFIKELGEYES